MILTITGLICAALLAALQCSRSLLVTATKKEGGYSSSPEEVLLAQEVLKLAIAVVLFVFAWVLPGKTVPKNTGGKISKKVACLLYAVPALCYAAQNLIVFYALLYIDPPTFQLFTQLKIVTTAIVFVVIQRRHLSQWQWLAVFLLLIASALGQWKDVSKAGVGSASDGTVGFILSLIYCFLSTMSGAVRESLLKFSDLSMSLQQVIIYAWSVVINVVICSIFHPEQRLLGQSFDSMTWVVIWNGAVLGHITGAVAKYADNLISAFAAAISLFMSTGLSVWFFSTQVNLAFFAGLVLSVASIFLYLQDSRTLDKGRKE